MHLRSDLVRFVSVLGLLGPLTSMAAITGYTAVAGGTDTAMRDLPVRPVTTKYSSGGRIEDRRVHTGDHTRHARAKPITESRSGPDPISDIVYSSMHR